MIRATVAADISTLQNVLDQAGLFPSEMLPDMMGIDENSIWLTSEADGVAVGFCYAVPEELAEGAWNMLAIAVSPDVQASGNGAS
jgi:N-acetylglutamate synthase-like GNAT family acetyltransferase